MNEQVVLSLTKACGLKTGHITIAKKQELKENHLYYDHGIIVWNKPVTFAIFIEWEVPFWSWLGRHCRYRALLFRRGLIYPDVEMVDSTVSRYTSTKRAVKELKQFMLKSETQIAFNREDKDEAKRVVK